MTRSISLQAVRAAIKPWMLPIAMLLGIVLHDYIGYVAFLSRPLIFIMLLITYCRVRWADLRLDRSMLWLLSVQVLGALGVYVALRGVSEVVAQAAFICVFCPTATAAPVITGMLGGRVARVATYSLLSHLTVALLAPPLLTWINPSAQIDFAAGIMRIAQTVLPLILGPLAVALALQRWMPRAHRAVAEHQGLSFYIWAVALLIVVANSVSFVMREPPALIPQEIAIAGVSMLMCVMQFATGRYVGHRYGDPISSAQSLGQKNTVLGIWLAMQFLSPLASIGPAAYVAWHNTINSYQIYRRQHAAARRS